MNRTSQIFVPFIVLLAPAALFATEPAANAQARPTAEPPAPVPKEQESVKITLHPMAETRPALKYQLLPPFLDRHPGNAALCWYRTFEDQNWFLWQYNKPDGIRDKTEKWMAIPIDDPREKEFRSKEPAINQLFRSDAYSEMDYAAR